MERLKRIVNDVINRAAIMNVSPYTIVDNKKKQSNEVIIQEPSKANHVELKHDKVTFLRNGGDIGQDELMDIINQADPHEKVALSYYLEDNTSRLMVLNQILASNAQKGYSQRYRLQAEVINALSSFEAGSFMIQGEMTARGQLNLIHSNGINFGVQLGARVEMAEVYENVHKLEKVAEYLAEANKESEIDEKIFYVDITPDKIANKDVPEVGWTESSMFISIGFLRKNSANQVAIAMLYEARVQHELKKKNI